MPRSDRPTDEEGDTLRDRDSLIIWSGLSPYALLLPPSLKGRTYRGTLEMNRSREEKKNSKQKLNDLVRRIHRLCPDHRNPHRFHEEKSDIAYELTKLARQVA